MVPNDPGGLSHAVNHLVVDDLGTTEVLVCACDDGDVLVYTTRSIQKAIDQAMEAAEYLGERLSVLTDDDEIKPLMIKNVLASAWGIAVHSAARLIAISSNTHKITVFAFALEGANEDRLPELEGEKEDDLPDRSLDQTLVLGGHLDNIPSVAFCNSGGDPHGRYLVSTDIRGTTIIWDIWKRRDIKKIEMKGFASRNRIHPYIGWSVSCIEKQAFRIAGNERELLGCAKALSPGGGYDVSAGVSKVEDSALWHPGSHPDAQPTDEIATDESDDEEGAHADWAEDGFGNMITPSEMFDFIQHINQAAESENANIIDFVQHHAHDHLFQHLLDVSTGNAHPESTTGDALPESTSGNASGSMTSNAVPESATGNAIPEPTTGNVPESTTDNEQAAGDQMEQTAGEHSVQHTAELILEQAEEDIAQSDEMWLEEMADPHNPGELTAAEMTELLTGLLNHRPEAGDTYPSSHLAASAGMEKQPRSFPPCSKDIPFTIFHTGVDTVNLLKYPFESVSATCIGPCHQHIPRSHLDRMNRLNMVHHVADLGIVIAATQRGRAAIFTLTRMTTHSNGKVKERYAMRLDWVLPFASQEGRGERPHSSLLGIAVAPVQGRELEKKDSWERLDESGRTAGRWRLLLTYQDNTVLSYELWRGGGLEGQEEELLVL